MQLLSFYYYCGILILLIVGVSVLIQAKKSKGKNYIKFRKRVIKDVRKKIGAELVNHEATRLMIEAGLSIDSRHYNFTRYLMLMVVLTGQIGLHFRDGVIRPQFLLVATGIFLLSIPTKVFLGVRTPFGYLMDSLKTRRRELVNKEVFEAMTQLKNLCIAQSAKPLSGDYLIEQIIKFSDVTKPAYTKLLTLWRLGESQLACDEFGESLNTKMSKEFANILVKLESMQPAELASHLDLFQSHIREERMTAHLRKQESLSYILYAPVIASAFLIMLNFMIIVIWMDTVELIQKI